VGEAKEVKLNASTVGDTEGVVLGVEENEVDNVGFPEGVEEADMLPVKKLEGKLELV